VIAPLALTEAERAMLVAAIDSHIYWQLAEPAYRRDGFVLEPGSDDAEAAEQIRAFQVLQAALSPAPEEV